MERKLATVLFVDLVGSTELVASADPEIVRRRVDAFFDQVSHCIDHARRHRREVRRRRRHGRVRRPARARGRRRARRPRGARDPRARRASSASRRGSASSPARSSPTRRESTFATGEAVNVAARLQQAAGAGRDPDRPGAARLTRDRIELEPVGPLELRGFARAGRRVARRLRRRATVEPRARRALGAVRRPRVASSSCSRTPSRAPSATAARTSSPSTASRVSARAGSRASSSPGVEGATVLPAAACPTARASRTGRSPRW